MQRRHGLALARLLSRARASEIPVGQLRAQLSGLDVLLVGEEHFYRETTRFLCELLEGVEGRRVTLLLELPSGLQVHVDEWVRTGASAGLAAAVREGQALPLGEILSWAHGHPQLVSRVVAMDEDRARIFVNRALLRDTRNATMARAILDARRERPADLAVAYGRCTCCWPAATATTARTAPRPGRSCSGRASRETGSAACCSRGGAGRRSIRPGPGPASWR